MTRRTYTPEEKAEALAMYVELGCAETARRTGIAEGTLASWAHRAGVQSIATEKTVLAVESHKALIEERKQKLADGLLADAQRLRTELWAPCIERVVKTVSVGHGQSEAEIVDVERDQPTFGDKKTILVAIAIAVDKVQLLTGAATERVETVSVEDRENVEQRLDQLVRLRSVS